MKVILDLRPLALVESQKQKLNIPRLLLVLFFAAFFLVGGTTLVMAFMRFRMLRTEVARLQDTLVVQNAQNDRMETELQRLSETEELYVSALTLLQEELPALEFLNALEKALPYGVWMKSVSIVPGRASLQGNAFNENDVVEFAKGLLDASIVVTVDFPVTTRVVLNNESLVAFTLSCRLRDFPATISSAFSDTRKEREAR